MISVTGLDARRHGTYRPGSLQFPTNRTLLMRRALAAVAISGVLLTGSACSSHDKAGAAATPSPTPAASPTPTGPDYTANTALVCGKLPRG